MVLLKDLSHAFPSFIIKAIENKPDLQFFKIAFSFFFIRAWLNGNTMFYETFVCFYVSEAKLLCFSLCSKMFDGVERC